MSRDQIDALIRADRRARKAPWISDVVSDAQPIDNEERALFRAGLFAAATFCDDEFGDGEGHFAWQIADAIRKFAGDET